MQFPHLRRLDFVTPLGGAVAWPLAAYGQAPAMPIKTTRMVSKNSTATASLLATGIFLVAPDGNFSANSSIAWRLPACEIIW